MVNLNSQFEGFIIEQKNYLHKITAPNFRYAVACAKFIYGAGNWENIFSETDGRFEDLVKSKALGFVNPHYQLLQEWRSPLRHYKAGTVKIDLHWCNAMNITSWQFYDHLVHRSDFGQWFSNWDEAFESLQNQVK